MKWRLESLIYTCVNRPQCIDPSYTDHNDLRIRYIPPLERSLYKWTTFSVIKGWKSNKEDWVRLLDSWFLIIDIMMNGISLILLPLLQFRKFMKSCEPEDFYARGTMKRARNPHKLHSMACLVFGNTSIHNPAVYGVRHGYSHLWCVVFANTGREVDLTTQTQIDTDLSYQSSRWVTSHQKVEVQGKCREFAPSDIHVVAIGDNFLTFSLVPNSNSHNHCPCIEWANKFYSLRFTIKWNLQKRRKCVNEQLLANDHAGTVEPN